MRDRACPPAVRTRCTDKTVEFPEVYARLIKDVQLCNGHVVYDESFVYTDNSIFSLFARDAAALERVANSCIAQIGEARGARVVRITDPVLLTSNEGSGTWGHWVVHNFPKIALAGPAYPEFRIMMPAAYNGSRRSFGELARLCGIADDRVIGIRPELRYRIDHAAIVDFLYHDGSIHPHSLGIFDALSNACATRALSEHVLIERTTPAKREISNHDDFRRQMSRAGFKAVALGNEPVHAQIATWGHGSEFCSVLGSDLVNIVFGSAGASILSITPAWFNDDFFFELAAARGMVWNELVCGKMDVERSPIHRSAFSVDEAALGAFLEHYVRGSRS